MKNKKSIIFCIILILGVIPIISAFAYAQDNATIKIHIIGEQTQTRFGSPVVIAGIWHYFNVTTNDQDFQILNLKFYSGKSIPSEGQRDETNYYEWQYNKNIEKQSH